MHTLNVYWKLELAKERIGVGGVIAGEQIGRPLGYADNAGIWGLIWAPKINADGSRRFILCVIGQVQPYADLTLLSRVCRYDPNPRSHAASQDNGHSCCDQDTGGL